MIHSRAATTCLRPSAIRCERILRTDGTASKLVYS
jgi:hypothetical protein